MTTRTDSTTAPGETHSTVTETDSQWLPTQYHPKGDPIVLQPWELEIADFCTTRLQLRHCSQNEVVEVEFALFQSEATELGKSQETAFAGLVRSGKGEVRVSTLAAEKKWELVRAKPSEISSFMKHAAVQAATRSCVHPTALVRRDG